jgi:hypothetical protein
LPRVCLNNIAKPKLHIATSKDAKDLCWTTAKPKLLVPLQSTILSWGSVWEQHSNTKASVARSNREREREMRVAHHGTYLGEILKSCEREVCACSKDSERYLLLLLLLLLLARFLYGGGSPGLQALKVLFGDSSGSVRWLFAPLISLGPFKAWWLRSNQWSWKL